MKKSLIAAAVAGMFAAPAFAATSNVDIYGILNIAVQDTDAANSDVTVLDNTSRIGLKGSEDLGGGLKAIWQIESALGGNGTTAIGTNATLGTRNTFVGLSGGFGTVVLGKHDTPYKMSTGFLDIMGDTIGDYNLGRADSVSLLDNNHDHRAPQALAYISPTFSGFSAAAAITMSNGESGSSLSSTNDAVDAISLSVNYANGPLTVGAGYQSVEDSNGTATAASDTDAWKIGVAYAIGDLTIGAAYEDVSYTGGTDRDSWLLNAKYTMGPIVLKALYGQVDAATEGDMWAIGADYNLSKRTTAYVVYAAGDDDSTTTNGGDLSGWNIGVKHSF